MAYTIYMCIVLGCMFVYCRNLFSAKTRNYSLKPSLLASQHDDTAPSFVAEHFVGVLDNIIKKKG